MNQGRRGVRRQCLQIVFYQWGRQFARGDGSIVNRPEQGVGHQTCNLERKHVWGCNEITRGAGGEVISVGGIGNAVDRGLVPMKRVAKVPLPQVPDLCGHVA